MSSVQNIVKQFELMQIKKERQKEITLDSINDSLRSNVLRLLNREGYQLKNQTGSEDGSCWLYINPHSKRVLIWNLLYLTVFYLVELQISLSLAFGPHFFEEELQLSSIYLPVYLTFLVFMVVDMILCFFKGYYAFGKGKVVDEHGKIVRNNLRSQFPFDIVVVVLYAVPLFHQSLGWNFLQLFTAGLIWIKKFKYQNEVEVFLQYRPGIRAAFMLSILFIDVLMVGNYGACIFIGMDLFLYSESYYGTGENSPYYWLTTNTAYPYSLIAGPWYYQYIYGQQFSTGTLSTLAPGPFGKNPYEILYSILVMIFFVVLASYVAEVLIQIVYTYTRKRIFHEDNIISFDNFMQLKEVGKSIRRRIYNFFELIWEVELKMETKQQQEMISKLPLYLKEELLLQIGFTKYLYFLQALPKEMALKKMISMRIKRITLDSNTCIFSSEELVTSSRSVYFIKQGMAKFYLPERHYQRGEGMAQGARKGAESVLSLSNLERVLGVYQFVTGQNYSICCKSIDLCLIQSLSLEDFKEMIAELHMEEQFWELKHRVLVEKQLEVLRKVCVVCLQVHIQSDCPEIYPRAKFESNLRFENRWGSNKRFKHGRKKVISTKVYPRQLKSANSNIFNLIPGVDIGQLLVDFYKLSDQSLSGIQQVCEYHSYFKESNVVNFKF